MKEETALATLCRSQSAVTTWPLFSSESVSISKALQKVLITLWFGPGGETGSLIDCTTNMWSLHI